jgi:hypothetical protein
MQRIGVATRDDGLQATWIGVLICLRMWLAWTRARKANQAKGESSLSEQPAQLTTQRLLAALRALRNQTSIRPTADRKK